MIDVLHLIHRDKENERLHPLLHLTHGQEVVGVRFIDGRIEGLSTLRYDIKGWCYGVPVQAFQEGKFYHVELYPQVQCTHWSQP